MIIQLKFKGIDDWDRPVYKDVNNNMYFGSTVRLVRSKDTIQTLNDYFNEHKEELEYFGEEFNCEPHGGMPFKEKVEFEILG